MVDVLSNSFTPVFPVLFENNRFRTNVIIHSFKHAQTKPLFGKDKYFLESENSPESKCKSNCTKETFSYSERPHDKQIHTIKYTYIHCVAWFFTSVNAMLFLSRFHTVLLHVGHQENLPADYLFAAPFFLTAALWQTWWHVRWCLLSRARSWILRVSQCIERGMLRGQIVKWLLRLSWIEHMQCSVSIYFVPSSPAVLTIYMAQAAVCAALRIACIIKATDPKLEIDPLDQRDNSASCGGEFFASTGSGVLSCWFWVTWSWLRCPGVAVWCTALRWLSGFCTKLNNVPEWSGMAPTRWMAPVVRFKAQNIRLPKSSNMSVVFWIRIKRLMTRTSTQANPRYQCKHTFTSTTWTKVSEQSR